MSRTIEIMDTTLRDGEQTDGVSFSAFEKMQIARYLLEKLGVDRIEIASARVSPGEQDSVREIFDWARARDEESGSDFAGRIEILGFVDHIHSVDWIHEAGGRVINLLTKGSERHCREQLRKTLAQHLADIEKTVRYAESKGVKVNVYLEDWSNGQLQSPEYVFEMLTALSQLPIHRYLLPDTLGILSPAEVVAMLGAILERFPELPVDFHGHNDYGLATANCLAAASAGARGLHVAVNGLGERAGNAPLESVVTALHDKTDVRTKVVEAAIMDASRLVETFSGKRIAPNRPIVGADVYTQTAGIHADGDKKNNLYANPILPERFGRQRVYALGKLSGRASLSNNLKMLGIEISEEKEKALLERVIELGEKLVTPEDLPFLINDMFGSLRGLRLLRIVDAKVTTELGRQPSAEVVLDVRGEEHRATGGGGGGYDAFMNALKKIAAKIELDVPKLYDYEVRIPPGGRTDALVETLITWKSPDGRTFRTIGVAPDQLVAVIQATEKMLNRLPGAALELELGTEESAPAGTAGSPSTGS